MFFDRLARGWALTKASLHVLRLDSEILVLPVLSGVVMVLLAAGVFVPLVLGTVGGAEYGSGVWIAAALLVYFLGYFVVIFFNAGVVAMATIRFDGGDPVVRDGLRTSKENWVLILQWALVAATVGLVLRMLRGQMRQRYGFLADLLVGGLEVAWSALIYFVVPLLVYRKIGPMAAIRESTALIRRAWGETLAGEVSMGLVFAALGVVGLLALLGTLFLGGSGLMALVVLVAVVLYWVVLAVVYSAAQGVLTAALYKYATTGQVPQGFDSGTMARAIT
ncbi:MAG TPA: DUF6159 family protein [Candidatus Thermoplasmatota archaeon]|jgi:hypothetical protein|nr:DUF6159 family protein [Candidatus Thermoplasmatota archaeon]